jgi:hypothetical protein
MNAQGLYRYNLQHYSGESVLMLLHFHPNLMHPEDVYRLCQGFLGHYYVQCDDGQHVQLKHKRTFILSVTDPNNWYQDNEYPGLTHEDWCTSLNDFIIWEWSV